MEAVDAAVGAGRPVRVALRHRASGAAMTLALRPAGTDQLTPSKPVGVPNWVRRCAAQCRAAPSFRGCQAGVQRWLRGHCGVLCTAAHFLDVLGGAHPRRPPWAQPITRCRCPSASPVPAAASWSCTAALSRTPCTPTPAGRWAPSTPSSPPASTWRWWSRRRTRWRACRCAVPRCACCAALAVCWVLRPRSGSPAVAGRVCDPARGALPTLRPSNVLRGLPALPAPPLPQIGSPMSSTGVRLSEGSDRMLGPGTPEPETRPPR